MPYDDIKQMHEYLRQQNEYFFVAGETIGARALVALNTSGRAVQASANIIDAVGVNAKASVYTTGVGFDAQVKGVAKAVADAPINPGRALKAGYGGNVGQFVDADLVNSTIIETVGRYAGTWTHANNVGNTSRVQIVSANNVHDVFNVLVFAEYALAHSLIVVPVTLKGTTPVLLSTATVMNDEWSTILGVSFLDGEVCTGIVTIEKIAAGADIVTLAAGQSAAGYWPIPDGRAYNDLVSVVEVGNSRIHLGIYGYNQLNVLDGEVIHLRANVAFGSEDRYREIKALLVGCRDTTDSVTIRTTGTEDDENAKIGYSLEEASAQGVELDILLE